MENLNPIPFKPHKFLDFSKHEDLFRKLGLWDFVNVDFDNNVRKDLLVQLIATYESRCCYVNGHRIGVSKVDFARAFKIPLDYGSVVDCDPLSKEVIVFVTQFVLHWVLLEDDDFVPPDEIMKWIKVMKDGHPEKVDWAGMIWFMVEKELAQGENLKTCYFASHLQYLMKENGVFSREEADGIVVGIDAETNKVGVGKKDEGNKESEIMKLEDSDKENGEVRVNDQDQWLMHGKSDVGDCFFQCCGLENGRDMGQENSKIGKGETGFVPNIEVGHGCTVYADDVLIGEGLTGNVGNDVEPKEVDSVREGDEKVDDAVKCSGGPSVELALGPDNETEENNKERKIVEFDDLKEKNDGERVNKQDQWLMHGKNDARDHFLQCCGSENGRELGEDSKFGTEAPEFEDKKEAGHKFNVFANNAGLVDGLTDNFLQSVEANQITFSSGQPDSQQMGSGPSFSYYSGNWAFEHDGSVSHLLNDGNKRLKINCPIEMKPLDFGTCLDTTRKMIKQAGTLYQKKENALEESRTYTQILLDELQIRDTVIELLQKSRSEEMQKWENDIYRHERELISMGNVLDGYRNALEETKRAFDEYRKKAQEKENVLEQSDMHTQILLNELQKQDAVIKLLEKSKYEEMQKKDSVIELLQKSILLLK